MYDLAEDAKGATLRDYFANSAMQKMAERAYFGNDNFIAFDEFAKIAKYSYELADVMLQQRENTNL